MTPIAITFGTPRKLPKASSLKGRVVVLDIAFAANAGGASFEKTTKPFIERLGERLAMWIDHHDHMLHGAYANDPRFVLRTKAEHPACPELVTPERVAEAGHVDTLCCHVDFDGLCSAAKWVRQGEEPYPGADEDARKIDTRLGEPSALAQLLDRAIRARPKDEGLRHDVVNFLIQGTKNSHLLQHIESAADELRVLEETTTRLAENYRVVKDVAIVNATGVRAYEKTLLLLLGQEHATVALVYDHHTVTLAARFDSGMNLVHLLGLDGGMPTRVSVSIQQLDQVLQALGVELP